MRRIAAFWLTALLLLPLLVNAAPLRQGLLWKLSRPGQADAYLFGTVHVSSDRTLPLIEAAKSHLRPDMALVLEIDPRQMHADRGDIQVFGEQSLTRQLSQDEGRRLLQRLQITGLTAQQIDRLQPWSAALQLISLSLITQKGISPLGADLRLAALAFSRQQTLIGLETADEQLDVFRQLPAEIQLGLLKDALKPEALLTRNLQRLIDGYAREELPNLEQLMRQEQSVLHGQAQQLLINKLLTERDARMSQRLQPLLARQACFVAIGAGHLPGVLQHLEQAGYQLTAVPLLPGNRAAQPASTMLKSASTP